MSGLKMQSHNTQLPNAVGATLGRGLNELHIKKSPAPHETSPAPVFFIATIIIKPSLPRHAFVILYMYNVLVEALHMAELTF